MAVIKQLEPRARVELRLTGGVDGAIPLDELSKVAAHAQELVRKLARAVVGKDGRGRPPAYLDKLTDLVAVGIHQGSAVLEIEAPAWSTELDLSGEVEFDAGVQALELVAEALVAVAQEQPLPGAFTGPSRDELQALLGATSRYDRLEWDLAHHDREVSASITPSSARVPPLFDGPSQLPERGSVEGELYALNARTGNYTVEDLSQHAIRCHVDPGSPLSIRLDRLVRQTVTLSGELTRDQAGRITDITVEEIESRRNQADDSFSRFDAVAALADIEPIASVSELSIADLSPDEADSFRRALGFE